MGVSKMPVLSFKAADELYKEACQGAAACAALVDALCAASAAIKASRSGKWRRGAACDTSRSRASPRRLSPSRPLSAITSAARSSRACFRLPWWYAMFSMPTCSPEAELSMATSDVAALCARHRWARKGSGKKPPSGLPSRTLEPCRRGPPPSTSLSVSLCSFRGRRGQGSRTSTTALRTTASCRPPSRSRPAALSSRSSSTSTRGRPRRRPARRAWTAMATSSARSSFGCRRGATRRSRASSPTRASTWSSARARTNSRSSAATRSTGRRGRSAWAPST